MKKSKLTMVLRILFGLMLLFFGLNGFLQFFPVPEMNEAATALLSALMSARYILAIMSIVFLLAGLSFVLNKWSALMALILLPFTVNILLFHIFLERAGLIMAIVMVLLNIAVLCEQKSKIKPLLAA